MFRYLFACFFSFLGLFVFDQNAFSQTNDHSFEEMVQELEKPSRSSWQKPEVLMDLMRPLKNKKVMDLGCGTGFFTFRMVDSGATIIAADIDERFLAYVDSVRDAREISKKQVQTRKVPADNPMLDKREVDIVLIVNTYHHLQDRVNYMKKVKAGLKSTGYVVIIDFFKKDLPIGPPTDQKLSSDDVTRELKMAGFSQFKAEEKSLPYQYMVFAL